MKTKKRMYLLMLALRVPLACLDSCWIRGTGGTFISLHSEHLLNTYCMLVPGLVMDIMVTRLSPGLPVLMV